MKFASIVIAVALIGIRHPSVCESQDAKDKWAPAIAPVLSLEHVAIAKSTVSPKGALQVSILLPQWRTEKRTGKFNVMTYRSEVRTRTVPNPSGNGTVEESYSVKLPYTETKTRTFDAKIPTAPKRLDVPIEEVSILRSNGEFVEGAEKASLLEKTRHVFLLREEYPEFSIDAFHSSFLRDDALVLWIHPTHYPDANVQK